MRLRSAAYKLLHRLGAARLGFDSFEFDLDLVRKALGVIVPRRLRPVGHALARRQLPAGARLRQALRAGDFLAAGFLAAAFLTAAAALATGLSQRLWQVHSPPR